jgi:protein-disulfide isomerase
MLTPSADHECSFCRLFEAQSLPLLKKDYIDTGKVRFVLRDLPLDMHPNALPAALAARCAGDQHRFWEMHDAMMQDPATDLGPEAFQRYARNLNLDIPAFDSCLKEKRFASAIQRDVVDAGAAGIGATPSFVIGRTDENEISGVRIVGAMPYSVFDSAIKELLSK